MGTTIILLLTLRCNLPFTILKIIEKFSHEYVSTKYRWSFVAFVTVTCWVYYLTWLAELQSNIPSNYIWRSTHKIMLGWTNGFWRHTDNCCRKQWLRYSRSEERLMARKGKHLCFLYLHCNQCLYSRQSHYYKLQLEAFLPCKGIHKNMSDHVSWDVI